MHMILKSDLKMAQASARCIPHLLFEDDCGHNQATYNCKHSDVLSNSNVVRRWVRPIAGEMSTQTSLLDIFSLTICMVMQKKWKNSQTKFDCNRQYRFLVI